MDKLMEMVYETAMFLVNHFDVSYIEAQDAVVAQLGNPVTAAQQRNYKKVREEIPYLNSIVIAAGSYYECYDNALYNGTTPPASFETRIMEYLAKCDISVPCFS